MLDRKLPMWHKVAIELHSYCNRDCDFCPRFFDRSGIRKDKDGKKIRKRMPTEHVYNIIDQAKYLGYRGLVGFHGLSEGFLDSRIVEFSLYVKKQGMKLLDASNGDALRANPELCRKLDGVVDTFRIGLYDYQNQKEKEREMEYWINRFKKTRVRFSLPLENTHIRQNSKIYYESKRDERILDDPCFRTNKLLIRYDGNISLCCQDDLCQFDLGNAFQQDIEKIWWSERHTRIVNQLKRPGSRRGFELCRQCYIGQYKHDMSIAAILNQARKHL